MWAEAYVSIINQGSQPGYSNQYLRPPNPNASSSSSTTGTPIQGRQRQFHSEIAEEEDDDVDGSTTIRAAANFRRLVVFFVLRV